MVGESMLTYHYTYFSYIVSYIQIASESCSHRDEDRTLELHCYMICTPKTSAATAASKAVRKAK